MKFTLKMLSFVFIMGLVACGGEGTDSPSDGDAPATTTSNAQFSAKTDLTTHGIPFSINTPEGVNIDVKPEVLGMQEVEVHGDGYHISITGIDATTMDTKVVKNEALAEVKESSYCSFTKMIQEDDAGFIFEKSCKGSSGSAYDFRYIVIKGNKAYTIGPSNIQEKFTEEQIKAIYASVAQ